MCVCVYIYIYILNKCNYSLTQHLVARYVYIYYMESNNNYVFRHLLMAIFRLYMKTLLWAVVQSIYVNYLHGVWRG